MALFIIGGIALVIWLLSDENNRKGNAAGAIASIAIGMTAGKAINKAITGGAPE